VAAQRGHGAVLVPLNTTIFKNAKAIVAEKDGKLFSFSSIHEASRQLNIDFQSIRNSILFLTLISKLFYCVRLYSILMNPGPPVPGPRVKIKAGVETLII